MKGKQRKSSNQADEAPEPRWRQRKPPARRQKVRKNQAMAPKAAATPGQTTARSKGDRPGGDGGGRGGAGKPRLRLPALNLSRLTVGRPAWRQWALLPLLALLAYGAVELSNNYRFFVFAAEIRGNGRVPTAAIYSASGIDGMSIFWVRAAEVADQIKKLEGIADATVHVRLPNQVIIDVRERVPLLIWKAGGQDVWISEEGEAIPPAGAAPLLTLTDPTSAAAVIQSGRQAGNSTAKASAETQVSAPLRLSPAVLANIKALHAGRPDLNDIHYGRQEGLYFLTPEGWAVYLGDEGDVARKLATLQAVRQQAASEGKSPKIVDLRLEGQAFYK